MVNRLIQIAALVSLSSLAFAEAPTWEHIKKLALDGINRTVPAESYPSKCIVRYTLNSDSKTGNAVPHARPSNEELEKILGEVTDAASLKAAVAKLEHDNPPSKIESTSGILIYKVDGVVHSDEIFHLSSAINDFNAMMAHTTGVISTFADRYCPKEQSELHLKDENIPRRSEPAGRIKTS